MNNRFIIIGAGLAGLSAALTCAKNGDSVILVSDGYSERSQSVMAEGGINGAIDTQNDSPEAHFQDTLFSSCGLAKEEAIRALTQAAPIIIKELARMGVNFNTEQNGKLSLRPFGGQKNRRTAFAGTSSGKQILTAINDEVRKYEINGIVIRKPHHLFRDILIDKGVCTGAIIFDKYSQKEELLYANGVITASGGLNGLFKDFTGSVANTGYCTALLFARGVKLSNLEMIQYHPTTAENSGKRMLVSEAARGEGGRLFVYKGNEKYYFMEEKYPELKNLMPRDVTSREIYNISKEMNCEVFLDMTELDEAVFEKKLKSLREDCIKYLSIDPKDSPIPVFPGIHYFMGGIAVDTAHRTSLKGLYAAGECCSQYHGANRLGGNSLLGAVYGGKVAASTACEDNLPLIQNGERLKEDLPFEAALDIKDVLQTAMGVIRNEESLSAALEKIKENDIFSLLAKAVLRSALERRESRGAHFRSDYPERNDDKFKKVSVASFDGAVNIRFEGV